MRIAVDIGFGFIKVMSENGEKKLFPSIIAKRSETTLRGIVSGSGDDYSLTYWEEGLNGKENEKKCFVGDAGMTNGGTRKWEDKSDFNEEEMKIFISTAIGLVNPDNEETDLCVGLPMSYYIQKKDELLSVLQQINARVSFEGDKNTRKIKIRSVFCFPQGAGAYYSAILDKDGNISDYELAGSSVGVVDIGYRTVDFLVMAKGRKGIAIVDSLSGSLEEDGMNQAYQDIQSAVFEKVGREVSLNEIEKAILWFGGVLDHKKEKIFLADYEEKAYRERAEVVASKIKIKWGTEADRLSTILITGGGGQELFPVLNEKFDQAELQEESSYANCEGYLGAQAKKMKRG